MPIDVGAIRREQCRGVHHRAPAGVLEAADGRQAIRAVQVFSKWAVEEGELRTSPVARMQKPRLRETTPPRPRLGE
jgi:hypothetical protein